MSEPREHTKVQGRLVIVGFGLIAQGTLPLLLRHLEIDPSSIVVVTAQTTGIKQLEASGVEYLLQPLNRENYKQVLTPLLSKQGSILLNLSVNVSSIALVELTQSLGALYLDTCIEPWEGGYTDTKRTLEDRSNYAFREQALRLRAKNKPTAVIAHGANPGLVSYLVKQALVDLHRDIFSEEVSPTTQIEWASLAKKLDIRTIHIAERDTQVANVQKQIGEFVNTWSVDGFIGEGLQPAELGWGTHERYWPEDGKRHKSGCGAAIYLEQPGAGTKVRSWTPTSGPMHAYLITHNEAISISDYFTLRDSTGKAIYRPTCHYAYHPCNDAILSIHELAGRQWREQPKKRVMRDEIISGTDELGVLLAGHDRNAYWFGSQLTAEEAGRLAPYNSATSLQVCSSVLAGVVWAIENPNEGVVEADEIPFQPMLEMISPYLGPLIGVYTEWNPLANRHWPLEESIDDSDPWLFHNIRVW
ncbi:MAG: saccharopine dehydrogenase C-terminal domain-containing protein [Pirellulales bacterium]